MLQMNPTVFFLIDHYVSYPTILMRLQEAWRPLLLDVVERAWRLVAPARLVREWQTTRAAGLS